MLDLSLTNTGCDCPDLDLSECDILSNVMYENLIRMSLGTNSNNWFDLAGINWDKISNLTLNSTNINIIKNDFEQALSWIEKYNLILNIETIVINRNTLHINIIVNNEKIICYDLRSRRILNGS